MTPITAIYENGIFRPIGPVDLPEGSTVRIEPVASVPAGDDTSDWSEAKNARRCDLIDREIDGTLTPEGAVDLKRLQAEMLRYRRKVAPLPLEETRKLHQELLVKTY